MSEINSNSHNSKDKDYDLYIEERKILVDSLRESSRTFDKAILTLASGSFGFTIAFLKDIVPTPFENTKWLIHFSWSLFALSILLILISFLTSQKACLKQIENTYEIIINKKKHLQNTWGNVTTFLNYASIIVLIIAYFIWGLFVFFNY